MDIPSDLVLVSKTSSTRNMSLKKLKKEKKEEKKKRGSYPRYKVVRC
jgi:hypothetical protein